MKRVTLGAVVPLMLCLTGQPAQAIPLSALAAGQSLSLDFLTLFGWSAQINVGQGVKPDLAGIDVTAFAVGENTIEIRFDAGGQLTLTGESGVSAADLVIDLAVSFTASISGRPAIESVELGLPGYVLSPAPSTSFVYVEENIYAQQADYQPLDPVANRLHQLVTQVDPSNPEGPISTTTDAAALAGYPKSLFVYKNTLVDAAPVASGTPQTAGITLFTQRFTAAPEPGTWVLLAGGVGLLAARARRAAGSGNGVGRAARAPGPGPVVAPHPGSYRLLVPTLPRGNENSGRPKPCVGAALAATRARRLARSRRG